EDESFSWLNRVTDLMVGGEAFPGHLFDLLKKRYRARIFNVYGPTETTVWSTSSNLTGAEKVTIGTPIVNTFIFILDRYAHLQPLGAAGELYIGGNGVARGYLNNPELTAERFIDFEHSIFYRTGDWVRWLPGGNLEFLGRIDHQVKIRGFRIELAEIETHLRAHDQIKEVIVTPRADHMGVHYLCAYWTAGKNDEIPSLREYLLDRLPGYMIPSYFVKLAQFPLTPNGKINLRALPAPLAGESKPQQTYIAPGDRLEKKLVDIWGDILFGKNSAHPLIGMNDHFFDLGGHSLKAMLLAARIQKEFAVDFPLSRLFKSPRPRALADFIRNATKTVYHDILPGEEKEYYPLSSAQKRLFFLDRFEDIGTSYNIPVVLKVVGKPGKERFKNAFFELIKRHETLRTSFEFIGDEPVQRVHRVETIVFDIRETDIQGYDTKTIESYIDSFVSRFDLARPPLLRVELAKLAGQEYLLLFDMHHIISDGTSTGILIEEFSRLYAGEKLLPTAIQYKDYAVWQQEHSQSESMVKQEKFWLDLFSGTVPRLDLETDYPRPANFTFAGERVALGLSHRESKELRAICAHHGVTLFTSLMTVFNILLYKYTGEEDIVVGTITAGRWHPALQENIGMFANTLALRNYPRGGKTYLEFLHDVKETVIRAFENQELQFETLVDKLEVEREASRNPLFDICLVTQNFAHKEIKLPGLTLLPYDYAAKISQFDLTLEAWELGEGEEDIVFYVEYYTRLFKRETIDVFTRHFLNVIAQACRAPGGLISDIELMSEAEKQELVFEFNNTSDFYPAAKTIVELFDEQVQKSPGPVAVVFNNHYLSYAEVEYRSGELAGYLKKKKGLAAGDRVGMMMEKCLEGAIVLLGILKAGGVYVPVSPVLPGERLKHIIKDAGIRIIISQPGYLRVLDRLHRECKELDAVLFPAGRRIYDIEDVDAIVAIDDIHDIRALKNLWDYIGETSADEITGGGWVSSYTGAPISKLEMEEYGANVLEKLGPFLNEKTRVLEIGCSSGITMFRAAPRVGYYYGTDISPVIIEKNKAKVKERGYQNIKLAALGAHEIDQIGEKDFDLVIINSVVQDFLGYSYLRAVILKAMALMADGGYIFFGDIMDLDLQERLLADLEEFKRTHGERWYKTKTDFSGDLFVGREFFRELSKEIVGFGEPEFSGKIHTIENELTRFRYDVLVKINKKIMKSFGKSRNLFSKRFLVAEGQNDLAYIMYTSGSTGRPKGVMVEQRGVVNLVGWFSRTYEIGVGVHLLQLTDYSFDPSIEDIFASLLYGATLYVAPGELAVDKEAFRTYINKHQVHIIDFVPSALGVLLGEQEKLKSLAVVISGGERLEETLKDRLTGLGYRLYNHYGPTEITVDALTAQCSENEVHLGSPVANTRCYVVDKDGRLAGVGVRGELCIAGPGVFRGYLNDPELTATRGSFEKPPLDPAKLLISHDAVLYKTGDLVRWLPGGKLAFVGRGDRQVKIRGYRIEPGEIEKQIGEIDDIEDVAVVPVVPVDRDKEKGRDEKYLCAYFVSGKEIEILDLKKKLSKTLPDYMMPLYFVQVRKIPRKANGKIDSQALSDPTAAVTEVENFAAPRDEMEEKLAGVWAEVLGIEAGGIGIDGNFFELGGHSLKAAVLSTKIHRELNIKVPLAEIFRLPSIRALAGYMKQAGAGNYIAIDAVEKKEYYPLSPAQKRMVVLQQMASDNTGYNERSILEIEGNLDIAGFEKTFKALLKRHENLRTSIEMLDNEVVQRVHDNVEFTIEYFDLAADEHGQTRTLADTYHSKPFDLSRAPLWRVLLTRSGENKHLLLLDMHHIITDGISQGIFINDFMAIYRGEMLPPLRVQYKDFAAWQNREMKSIREQKTYWLNEFEDEIPVLNLPLDFTRPAVWSFTGNEVHFSLSPSETEGLNKIVKTENVTLFMVLLSLYTLLLARLSNQEDITVGTPTAGRAHADLEKVMGMFVNTLALRNFPQGENTFKEFLREVKKRTLNAFAHQDYPYDELVEAVNARRDPGRNPLFDVMLALQNIAIPNVEIPGLKLKRYDYKNRAAKFDMVLMVYEVEKNLSFTFEYGTKLFKQETIERFVGYFKNIISWVTTNPGPKIAEIEILSEEEKKRLSVDFNNTGETYSDYKTLHGLFEEQAARTPDHIAMAAPSFSATHITYKALSERTDPLARYLIMEGAWENSMVALMIERSPELIIGILGILKAGCGYVPLNPKAPVSRIKYLMAECGIEFLLINQNAPSQVSSRNNLVVLHFDHSNSDTVSRAGFHSLDNLAYVIYTSGSTGKPKGVPITHANLSPLLYWGYRNLDIGTGDRVLQNVSYYFDWSVWEIFITLTTGAGLYIIIEEVLLNPEACGRFIESEGITVLHTTPTRFHYLSNLGRRFETLKYLFIGGEKLTAELLANSFNSVNKQCRVFNMYGLTEVAIISSALEIPRSSEDEFAGLSSVPIGRPV
ncbi:MAG TPA: D-alanine--poly(phosphoribitol) ligase subunit DltA, partial [Candidatus Deferrimicrobium sp.]|nr:D-alanine--poly(phosphoribitol) ligase subunit DltA [Candidatus Deferrimicrobium sp.]